MKYIILTLSIGLFFSLQQVSMAQCSGDNTFLGTIDNDWDNPSNWSLNCVPTSTITGRLTISANCVNNNSINYTFVQGSFLEVQPGVNFSNNNNGSWTFNGTLINEGDFSISDLTNDGQNQGAGSFSGNYSLNGTMEPGNAPPPTWSCGDLLSYAGKDYATVQIGGQCWMAENLNIGTMLEGVLESHNNGVIEKYCYNNDPSNCDIYGGLYSLYEVLGYNIPPAGTSNQGLCPTGWHIPTDDEWMQLEGTVEPQYGYPDPEWEKLGFRGSEIGIKLKSTYGWNNGNGTDEFGFNALPAGQRDHDASGFDFYHQGDIAFFWSSTFYLPFVAYAKERQLWGILDNSYRGNEVTGLGYSVRCIKD
ncbi:MAG: hypothetical protein DWQ02_21790 [Bacteroidetes bacterium]|nr:MAG: hypothetical protein DWQ02_21790 [Bacteroidota bacterium]